MAREVLTVREDELVERAVSIILQHGVSGLPVVDAERRLVGIVTEHALLDVLFRPELRRQCVGRITSRDVWSVTPDATPQAAADLLIKHRIRRVPVVEDGRLVGLVSRRDLIRYATAATAADSDPHPPSAKDRRPHHSAAVRLLVIDGSRIIHEMIRDALQPLHVEATFTSCGAEALESARRGAYDLILLERFLPDIEGLEVLKRLRQEPSTALAPVIMVTSCDLPSHVAEAMDAGAVDYIRKPFSAAEVRARVQSALRSYRLQRELLAAKSEAEAASRSKSDFLANVSHEIRTPMTAILGYAELLGESLLDPADVQAVGAIRRNGRHLLEVIDDILDIVRIEAGRLEIESSQASPIEIAQEVLQMLRIRAQEKDLDLVVEIDGPVPKSIPTDSRRLRQILLNLVVNAIKFTERGRIRIGLAMAAAHTGQAALEFEISDTGIGIEPTMIERVFEPFAQGDSSLTRAHGGAGLGLAICRSLAAALGGGLRVRSQPGKGSTFTLSLGVGRIDQLEFVDAEQAGDAAAALGARPAVDASPCESEAPLAGCRVLLAEDGVDNQRLISLILRKAGAKVVLAENGRLALDLALSAPAGFDVVLMDIQMPVLDGCETTRRLRAAGFSSPIIALTAHAMPGDRQTFLSAGCDDFMPKPIQKRELIEMVQRYAQCAAMI
jgi:signal transduction histidine kinase